MAGRNERRRRARQQAQIARSEASHGDIVGATVVKTAEKISKAAESRQQKFKASSEWDPDKTVPPPIPPEALWTIFELNAIHAGAINAKVADAVGRGWKLEPEDPDEEGASDNVKHVTRALTDVLRAVCPKLTFSQLCQQAVRELDAIGWADWEILRDVDGDVHSEIVGILPVPAHTVRAVKHSDDVFCIRKNEKKVYFKRFGFEPHVDCDTGDIEGVNGVSEIPEDRRANELVHFTHYSPRSSWYGIPPWVSAMPAIAEFSAIREFNVSYFESGGQADRLIHVAASDDEVAKELSDKVVKQIEDARGVAHTTIVTHGSEDTRVDVASLEPKGSGSTGSTRDSNFRGGKEDLKEEIRIAHQMPPGRLGIAEGGALAGNANDSMDDDYRIGVVEPLQEIVEAELHRTIFGELGFASMLAGWEFTFEDRTQDDTADEHDRAMEGRDKGALSPNDAREKLGEERVADPAMDRYYIGDTPISTDPGVSDVKQLLSELKDALSVAVQDPGRSKTPESQSDDPGVVEQTTSVAMSKAEEVEPVWAKRLWRAVTRVQAQQDATPAAAPQPINVEVHIDKGAIELQSPPITFEAGAIDARTSIEKGAVEVDARTSIARGAVQAHLPAPPAPKAVQRRIDVQTKTDEAGRTVPAVYVVTDSES